jgi:serine protease AprX
MRISRLVPLVLSALLLLGPTVAPASAATAVAATWSEGAVTTIVTADSAAAAAALVADVGGAVRASVPIARSAIADLDERQRAGIEARGGWVTDDRVLQPAGADYGGPSFPVQVDAMRPATNWSIAAGAGVGVALIDTGVADVPDLANRLYDGPDLSGEGDGIDRFGHGTFMAGLIAGDGTSSAGDGVRNVGLAPSAHIVSVKVAGADGSTTLARLLTAFDWVVNFRAEYGVKVLNLSFAADWNEVWSKDPLAIAANGAADAGIVVVASSGNNGGRVASPATAPGVVAAGAIDTFGTAGRADDRRPTWSAQTPETSKPELLAPGVSTVSLRAPGSTIDVQYPGARVGTAYFRGSGTSMASALTSGAAAVLAAEYPDASASVLKRALIGGGEKVPSAVGVAVNLTRAEDATVNPSARDLGRSAYAGITGTASGLSWSGTRWADLRWTGTRWAGTRWAGTRWAGTRWADATWADQQWAGTRWAGTRWAADRWTSAGWTNDLAAAA